MHEVADAHGEGDAGGQDHQRTDDGMAGRGMQRLTQQDAHQCDEGRGGDLLEAAGQAVPPAQQQVAAGRQTGHGGSDGAAHKVVDGVVTWKDEEIDCAPEYMYLNSYEYHSLKHAI